MSAHVYIYKVSYTIDATYNDCVTNTSIKKTGLLRPFVYYMLVTFLTRSYENYLDL